MKEAATVRQGSRWIYVRPEFRTLLEAEGLDDLDQLSSRELGEPVTSRRSSWVRLVCRGSYCFYVKTYDYPHRRDRGRGGFRNTCLAASRAYREQAALRWLREAGFGAPEPLAVVEKRVRGWLRRAVLVTRAWPGHPLDRLLPLMGSSDRETVVAEVGDFVRRLHAAGFRDGNLDLRNLLAGHTPGGTWQLAKIDSPRYRIRPPGIAGDRAAQRDRARLSASFRAAGIPVAAARWEAAGG